MGRFEAVPTDHKPPRRPGTILGDRNESRRPRTPPLGVQILPESWEGSAPIAEPLGVQILPPAPESWEGSDSYTPIAELLPDPIEVAAVRIDQRAEAIRERPGPTPPPEALQSALTIHGVRAELHELKRDVKAEFGIVHKKVDEVSGLVVKGLVAELDRRRDADHLIMRQKIEIGTASDIAKIDVDAARQIARVERRNKIVITLLGVATTVMTVLEARRC